MKKIITHILLLVVSLGVCVTYGIILTKGDSLFDITYVKDTDEVDEDIGEIYYKPIDLMHIAENSSQIKYIDNEVLIVAKEGIEYSQIKDIIEKYNAEIVGYIEKTGDYQLVLKDVHSYDELNLLISQFMSEPLVESASINYVSNIEVDDIKYGNKWSKDLKNSTDCIGKSWGIEAINAPAAWELLENNSEKINKNLRIGVIDNGFDLEHEDLGFAYKFLDYNVSVKQDGNESHGTHVAGTMAANSDNEKGICGVYPYGNGNLYAVSYGRIKSAMWVKVVLAELILRNVKVINASFGNMVSLPSNNDKEEISIPLSVYIQYRDINDETRKEVDKNSDILANYLQRMINMGYDFVIVNSAGNESNKKYKTSEEDVFSVLWVDAKYNSYFSAINAQKYPDVYNRIIVVGSVDEKYSISNFSCVGNRVDIFAPGEKIYSTMANNKYGNTYKINFVQKVNWSGTSMAAPHVAGVAAMVWAADSSLTGEAVKMIVCNSISTKSSDVKIVDAKIAVRAALGISDNYHGGDPEESREYNGGVMSYVVDIDDEDKVISQATVTAESLSTGKVYTAITDNFGHFELFLPDGLYNVSVIADGYKTFKYAEPIQSTLEGVNYIEWAKMTAGTDNSVIEITEKSAVDFYGWSIDDIVHLYGQDNCVIVYGDLDVAYEVDVNYMGYKFYSNRSDYTTDKPIDGVVVCNGGQVVQGVYIGDTVAQSILKSNGKFADENIVVSDTDGYYCYIEKTGMTEIYVNMSKSPSGSNDNVQNHIDDMMSERGLVKFIYAENDSGIAKTDNTEHHKEKMYAIDFYNYTIQDVIAIYGKSNCEQVSLTHGGVGLYVPELKYVFIPQQLSDDLVGSSKIQSIQIADGGEMIQGVIIGDLINSSIANSKIINENEICVSESNGEYILYHNLEGIDIYIDLNESPLSSDDIVSSHLDTMRSVSGLVKFSYDSERQSVENEETTTTTPTEITQSSSSKEQETYVDEEWIEYARSQVTKHYKEKSRLSGEFVCLSYEDIIEKEYVKFILRYSRPQEELEEIIANGGMPSANVYQSLIEIEVKTGKVTDESGNVWYLNNS